MLLMHISVNHCGKNPSINNKSRYPEIAGIR